MVSQNNVRDEQARVPKLCLQSLIEIIFFPKLAPRRELFFKIVNFLDWGTMQTRSHSAMMRIVNLLKEAKAEAVANEMRTLSYFIDMALVQTQDEASKPIDGGSNDIDKKAC